MKKLKLPIIAALSALSLTACGGGGSAEDEDVREAEVGTDAVSDSAAFARFKTLNDSFVQIRDDVAFQSVAPTSGSASYSGQLGFDALFGAQTVDPDQPVPADASVIGDLDMVVQFSGSRAVTGDVTNILYSDKNGNLDDATGTLSVTGTIVPLRDSNGSVIIPDVLSAEANGQITFVKDAVSTTVDLDLDLAGQFAGTNGQRPEAIRGFVIGEFDDDLVGGTGDLTLTIPNGRFAVNRN